MRLLVTGASGFIGRNSLLSLPESWEVVALHRPGNTAFLSFLERHRLRHVRPVACDLSDPAQVGQAASQTPTEFDSCLYLASNTSIPLSIDRPIDDLTTNTICLLHMLEQWAVGHLVYLSSGAVYMGLHGLVHPAVVVAPHLPYAVSKLASEHYIRSFARHRGNPQAATIIRFFGAFGPYEPARKVYTRLVRQFAFERNPEFTVLGDGENFIDAMYVDDAITALAAVLATPPEGVCTVDLGMGDQETVNQVVTRAAHAFGIEPRIAHAGTSPEYITFSIDPRPFRTRYAVTPTVSLEEGLRRLASHLAQEGRHEAD
jgi:nucleoside-diphosphate-sugar epimerase